MEQVKEKVCSEKTHISTVRDRLYNVNLDISGIWLDKIHVFHRTIVLTGGAQSAKGDTSAHWCSVAHGGWRWWGHRSPVSGKCFPWPSWLAGTTRNAFIEHNWPLRVQGHCHPCWLHCGEELWCLKFKLGADAARRSDFEAAYHMEDGIVGKLLMVKWVVNKTWVQLWNC